jgi:hypothetical protein
MPLARSVSPRRPNAPLRFVAFGEAAQHDVDRALPVLDVGVADVREDAAFGRLLDEGGIRCVEQDDDRAGGFAHDLVDQLERVVRALAEADERHVGALPGGHGADVVDLDLARDDLVSQGDHDRCDERQAILALVGDQDAQMLGLAVAHQRLQSGQPSRAHRISRRSPPASWAAMHWVFASPQTTASDAFQLQHSAGVGRVDLKSSA